MDVLGRFSSVFTRTGANMSVGANAKRENRELRQSAPAWARALRPLFIAHHRLRRLLGGMYSQTPFSYAIYTQANIEQRAHFDVAQPVARAPEI
jgi:hypothetical protein